MYIKHQMICHKCSASQIVVANSYSPQLCSHSRKLRIVAATSEKKPPNTCARDILQLNCYSQASKFMICNCIHIIFCFGCVFFFSRPRKFVSVSHVKTVIAAAIKCVTDSPPSPVTLPRIQGFCAMENDLQNVASCPYTYIHTHTHVCIYVERSKAKRNEEYGKCQLHGWQSEIQTFNFESAVRLPFRKTSRCSTVSNLLGMLIHMHMLIYTYMYVCISILFYANTLTMSPNMLSPRFIT